ncbi:MAG: uroporphyrinogen-III synthase [Ramlibacter sp.]|nr:uroporphyrinogen-III synthase [Ramlibacter sp.]
MRALVTRPAREAQQWVRELQQRRVEAAALPLIQIGPAPDASAVQGAWTQLEQYDAVMFVSGNAVDHFFALKLPTDASWPAATRAWAPGPGTRDALQRAGVVPEAIDQPGEQAEQFDSQALWAQVQTQLRAGQRMLVVRGGDASGQGSGRNWLAMQLAGRGVAVDTVVAYCRKPPTWSPAQLALAREGAGDRSIWLFSSSEAIANLRTLLPAQDWRAARAVATHPRIAQAASDAGFGVVCLSRPTLPEVVASIESIR